MSYASLLAADRRLTVLRALEADAGYALNDGVLKVVLAGIGHDVARDQVRADLTWLAEAALIRLEKLPTTDGRETWVAHLLDEGAVVARGKPHPGVARPAPG